MIRFADPRDRVLLEMEIQRLKSVGYSFQGNTEAERLGVDAWVLGVGVVEERKSRHKRIGSGKRKERSS